MISSVFYLQLLFVFNETSKQTSNKLTPVKSSDVSALSLLFLSYSICSYFRVGVSSVTSHLRLLCCSSEEITFSKTFLSSNTANYSLIKLKVQLASWWIQRRLQLSTNGKHSFLQVLHTFLTTLWPRRCIVIITVFGEKLKEQSINMRHGKPIMSAVIISPACIY